MLKAIRLIRIILIIFLVAAMTACAPSKKNTYYQKRNKASHVNTSQLGRNRYYFSDGYQKKLSKSYKKKR